MKFNFEATGIGSVPFKDPKSACEIIFEYFPTIPFWPQLPRRSYLENMYVQYSEGLPGFVFDSNAKTIKLDSNIFIEQIDEVIRRCGDGDVDFFRISEKYAEGFYKFLEIFKNYSKGVKFVKGHTIGPISYALSLTDENKQSVLYNNDIFEILTKVLAMKARWQIRKLKALFPKVIIFIDEPSLVSLGSSYVNINADTAFARLDELVKAIKDEGALCGLHCCGNTDWPQLLKRDIDIISFDAYNFMKEFLLYGAELKKFAENDGTVAWGLVPTSGEKPIVTDTLFSSLVTPSCGVGTLDEASARKVFEATRQVSQKLRQR